jgi:hypothetical protein
MLSLTFFQTSSPYKAVSEAISRILLYKSSLGHNRTVKQTPPFTLIAHIISKTQPFSIQIAALES